MWAVVPVKELRQAKQRLSSQLTSPERHRLVEAMVADVLEELSRVEGLEGVLVVTRDREAGETARRAGAEVLDEAADGGLNAALEQAAAYLVGRGVRGIVIVPGDVPTVRSEEIRPLIGHHAGSSPAVSIVSDRHGQGTNCLACSPPNLIPFRFGVGSFAAHQVEARKAGVEPSFPAVPSLELDIDTPEDLSALSSLEMGERTRTLLLEDAAALMAADPAGPRVAAGGCG